MCTTRVPLFERYQYNDRVHGERCWKRRKLFERRRRGCETNGKNEETRHSKIKGNSPVELRRKRNGRTLDGGPLSCVRVVRTRENGRKFRAVGISSRGRPTIIIKSVLERNVRIGNVIRSVRRRVVYTETSEVHPVVYSVSVNWRPSEFFPNFRQRSVKAVGGGGEKFRTVAGLRFLRIREHFHFPPGAIIIINFEFFSFGRCRAKLRLLANKLYSQFPRIPIDRKSRAPPPLWYTHGCRNKSISRATYSQHTRAYTA